MNTTKAKKLRKGFYQFDFAGHTFYIAYYPEIEGTNKWHVSCASVDVEDYMDSLWRSLSEAVFMIAYEFTTEE